MRQHRGSGVRDPRRVWPGARTPGKPTMPSEARQSQGQVANCPIKSAVATGPVISRAEFIPQAGQYTYLQDVEEQRLFGGEEPLPLGDRSSGFFQVRLQIFKRKRR